MKREQKGSFMRTAVFAYIATAIVFFGMDFIWLSNATAILYRPKLGAMLLDKPNLPVAAAFYLVYVVGVVAFAVLPALAQGDWTRALWGGALLGLVSYGTYDFTNLATLANWPLIVSLADLAWGTFATATAAVAGYLILRVAGV